jgi:LacI family transcriptional regulator
MALTLEDIAQIGGVSRSTVSRVLNGDPNVSDATRQKVTEIIRQYNFQPNLAARGLAAGHTRVLGLVIPMGVAAIFTDPFFSLLIQGVSQACNAHEYSVMLWLADPEFERRTIHQILYNGLVDGVILASMLLDDPITAALVDGHLPFITIGRHPTNEHVSYIDVDNRAGARDAVRFLCQLGRKRVASIYGPQNMIGGIERFEGYLDGLRENGLPRMNEWMAAGDFTEGGGYFAMQRLLIEKPDAVFVASDPMAMGAMRAIQESGLNVPEDIAVIGFDDLPHSAHTNPPLTTIRQPIQRMGMTAAEMLIEMIERKNSQTRRIVLPTEMVIRSSCGSRNVK